MSRCKNQISLLGNLSSAPVVRKTQAGNTVAHFNLATNESHRDRTTGEVFDTVQFHRVVVFGKLADICAAHLTVGARVDLVGKLIYNSWTDKENIKRVTAEVVLSGPAHSVIFLDDKAARAAADELERLYELGAVIQPQPGDEIDFVETRHLNGEA
jgi:single-strand DNA-binding protein